MHRIEQGSGDATPAESRPHADVVQMDFVPGIGKRRLRPGDDLSIGVADRFGFDDGEDMNLLGSARSERAASGENVLDSTFLKRVGMAAACKL
jgi:hypothetical protein